MNDRPGPLVVLVPSLGTTERVWEGPAAALRARRPDAQVVHVELPGHGRGRRSTEFAVRDVAAALIGEVEPIRAGRTAVVAGVSMGGAVALEAAVAAPDWVAGVGMFDSATRFGTNDGWADLIARVEVEGLGRLRGDSAEGWFSHAFRQQHPSEVDAFLDDLDAIDTASYLACCRALARYDGSDALAALRRPLLAVVGAGDRGPTPAQVQALAASVSGARYEVLAPAGHLSVVEHPHATASLLLDLIDRAKGVTP